MAATKYALIQQYQSYAKSAPYIASAFTDNKSNADLLQITQKGRVIVAVDYLGAVHFNATGLTASLGTGGSGLYTVNRQVNGSYRANPTSVITTVAQAFAAAFPLNPQSLDILQVIAEGASVGYYLNSSGVATGS